MKRKLFSALLALACAASISAPAAAIELTPVLSAHSETTASAVMYDYLPRVFHGSGTAAYGNTIYCVSAADRVYDDKGRLYELENSLLGDSELFTQSVKVNVNPMSIRSIKAITDPDNPGNRFAVTLDEYYLFRDLVTEFTVTYSAREQIDTTALLLGEPSVSSTPLVIRRGAKISIRYRLIIDHDDLYTVEFDDYKLPDTPVTDDTILTREADFPFGVDSIVITPDDRGKRDIEWSEGDRLVAELSLSGAELNFTPKLSTKWSDSEIAQKRQFTEAYIRFFRGNPDIESGTAELILTNPFLTFDGVETLPHSDVVIYEVSGTKLRDVTKSFSYTTDSNGYGAFKTSVGRLGNYILASGKISPV